MRSLRLRLLALAALAIAAALTVAGVLLVIVYERHLDRRVEHELEVRMMELEGAFMLDQEGKPELSVYPIDPRFDRPYSGAYWQVAEAGKAVLRSRSLWDEELDAGADSTTGEAERAVERTGPQKQTIYVLGRTVTIGDDDKARRFRLSVALDHAEIEDARSAFAFDVALALAAIGAVLLLGAWLQSVFGLWPLATVRSDLDAVHRGAAARLTTEVPDEIAPLAQDINRLLDHQSAMIRKARERAGSLAHGLKTPLTILAAEANRLARAGNEREAGVIRAQVAAMRGHVERELARARTNGASAGNGAHTDIAKTGAKLVDLMRRMPRGESLAWRLDVPKGATAPLDPDDFGEVVGNFLDNARKWAASSVCLTTRVEGGRVHVFVEDDGPGIAAAHKADVLKRGFQASNDVEGTGLGLSIATDVLDEYGLELVVEDRPEGGSRIGFRAPEAKAA